MTSIKNLIGPHKKRNLYIGSLFSRGDAYFLKEDGGILILSGNFFSEQSREGERYLFHISGSLNLRVTRSGDSDRLVHACLERNVHRSFLAMDYRGLSIGNVTILRRHLRQPRLFDEIYPVLAE